jgi:hypothetical protein
MSRLSIGRDSAAYGEHWNMAEPGSSILLTPPPTAAGIKCVFPSVAGPQWLAREKIADAAKPAATAMMTVTRP